MIGHGVVCGTLEDGYRQVMRELVGFPDAVVSPRGEETRELLGASLLLADPRARVLASPARAANYGFAAGEFLWYFRGANDVESLAYYNRRTPRWSDDGRTLAGAYGPRLFRGLLRGPSQWEMVVNELVRDYDSRRAVLAVYAGSDALRVVSTGGTKDVPCTLSLQFLLRPVRVEVDERGRPRVGRRLHLVVTMRSCDAVWGLCNDAFSFTLLQEVMLLELRERGVEAELGGYLHQAASLHLYRQHYDLARSVAAETCAPAPAMPPVTSRAALDGLLRDEASLRAGRRGDVSGACGAEAEAACGEAWLLGRLVEHRTRRDAEEASGRG